MEASYGPTLAEFMHGPKAEGMWIADRREPTRRASWTSASSAIHMWTLPLFSGIPTACQIPTRVLGTSTGRWTSSSSLAGLPSRRSDELETIDDEVLDACVRIIAKQREKGNPNIVVVHGAGSFGHFSAKKYGVADGGILEGTGAAASERLRKGVAETRASVGKLNSIVTSRLVAAGVPAVSLPTFGHWFTYDRGRQRAVRESAPGLRAVTCSIDSGFVPVLHGDVSLDKEQDCAVLSGDTSSANSASSSAQARGVHHRRAGCV